MSFYAFVGLLFVIVSVVHGGDKVCPGYGFIRPPEGCQSTCSSENDQCPMDKKCCFRIEQPCGYHCIVPKDDQPKNGKCPASSSTLNDSNWFLCDAHLCDVDSDCPAMKKCCSNRCGAPVCVSPQ